MGRTEDYEERQERIKKENRAFVIRWGTILSLTAITIIGGGMYGCPKYNVWQQGLAGEAELARAEQNRQIKIQEAKAKLEAAEFLNQAERKRAEGVAAANEIIAQGLKDNENYLKYLWIQGITESEGSAPTIIYVPTEAGLPILEAGRTVLE